MNTKLVESLAQIIQSLAPEEQILLEERLKATPKKDWRQSYQELNELRERIFARRNGQPLSPEPDEIIWQMREERTAEIVQSLQDS